MTDALGGELATLVSQTPASALEAEAVLVQLRERAVDTVILCGADTHGIMRGKRVPAPQLGHMLERGLPLCDVFWVMHVDESDLVPRPLGHHGYFPTEREGYPDIFAVPDLSTTRLVPWHDRTALILCDFHGHDGAPVPISPRQVLKRVIERAREMGFEPMCGVEFEFYVLKETSGSLLARRSAELEPLQERPSTYGVVMGSREEPLAHLIRESALAYRLPVEACQPETGPGQFEITLTYGPALKAADDAILFKTAVKELVAQHGLMATFMAKPREEWAGNSCHIHLSLTGADGQGVFFHADADHGISPLMRNFAGGTLATMSEFTAIMAPTVNSYRRFTPYSWAGTTATWAIDNRSTGLRAVCEGEGGTRIEHRQAGGDVNPYLAAAVALASGLHGIENGLQPPELIDGDVYALAPGAVPALPRTLQDATERLAASGVARDWLGDDFVSHFVEMKRAECEAQMRAVTDWEIARYLEAL
jgi:glutamine synthetase